MQPSLKATIVESLFVNEIFKDSISCFSIERLFTDIFLSILYWNLDNQEIQNEG